MEQFPRASGGQLNQEVGHLVSRLRKAALGRGPTRTQVFFRHTVIVVLMQDDLTSAERLLVSGGDTTAVIHARLRIQDLMRESLVAGIEELTGCKVEAFMSSNHIDPDLVSEMFVLDRPVPGETATA
jgi:uncharacterized protein YbcI